jgi:ABC-type multidrug transport system ATPase subunit
MGILNNVSFDIKQGESVAIRAAKGEGKTTLLRTLLGLYKPEGGAVTYGGSHIDTIQKFGPEALNKKFGYSPQNAGFIDTMTLKENLLLWNKDIPDQKIQSTMKDLGLDKLISRLDEKGSHYSGGEKRLLTIVRALLTEPKILFLDEPTANLDQASIDRLVSTLKTIKKLHPETTIITVTHDEAFAKQTDRTINLAALNQKPTTETPRLNDHQVLQAIARPIKR